MATETELTRTTEQGRDNKRIKLISATGGGAKIMEIFPTLGGKQ